MARLKGVAFIYIFVGAFIGMLFAPTINSMASSLYNTTTGNAQIIWGNIGVFYAIAMLIFMIAGAIGFLRSR